MIVDVWREYTSYEVQIEEEEATEITLNVKNTAGMDVVWSDTVSPSSGKFKNCIRFLVLLQAFERNHKCPL